MARMRPQVLTLLSLCLFSIGEANGAQYMGKLIGKLSELHHGVSGEVYAVDSRTLFIKDFTYDGQGPAAFFYASTSKAADRNGFRLRDEKGSDQVIRRYRKEGVTLTLPDGKTIHNIKIFYVWCVEFEVNFGDVKIPRNFDYPRPQKIDGLKGVHGVSSDNIVIVDAQTLLIPNLSYDGEAPDAKFWVGRGPKPSPQGIRVPDENGKENPLRRYDRKTVVLTLPGDLTVFEIGHFGIWCEAFTVDFGHVQIPSNLNVPPSLRMLGVSPQKRPHQFDISSLAPDQDSRYRPVVGGHLEATTYRPQFVLSQRRQDINAVPYNIDNVPYQQQQQQQQLQLQRHQQELFYRQQQLYAQQRALQLQQQPNNFYQQHHHQQQFVYNPINYQQRHSQEQAVYNQLLQNRRLQEEQLREQLNRQHNRFAVQPNNNQNAYVPFG